MGGRYCDRCGGGCRRCGHLTQRTAILPGEPIRFRGGAYGAKKRYRHGTHRAIAPEETLELLRPHLRTVGVTRIANITGLDRIGIPVTLAIRPAAVTVAISSGKGFTLEAANASAAMEATELHHAEDVQLPSLTGSHQEVAASHAIVAFDDLPFTKHSVFSVRTNCKWVLGWDIVRQEEIAVPLQTVEMGNREWPRTDVLQISSNGLASGNNLVEAISAGLCELVERDAVACQTQAWERSGRPPPVVDLADVQYPLVRELLDRLSQARVGPILFDCTVDTAVPTYMACLYDQEARHVGIFKGYGAHLDPEVAMVRALTEAVQGRLIYVAGSRDDFFQHNYVRLKCFDGTSGVKVLERWARTGAVEGAVPADHSTDTFEGDIGVILVKLAAAGLHQVIVLDLTLPGLPVHVVKVVVPGLEGYLFDFYAPGPRARRFAASAI